MTLLIDTRIETPDSDWVKEQNSQGFEVLHLPALEVVSLNTILDWSGVEALFLASSRAVFLAQEDLKKFNGPIWAVGPGTAKALTKSGLKLLKWGIVKVLFLFWKIFNLVMRALFLFLFWLGFCRRNRR